MLKDLRQLICWEAAGDKAKTPEGPVKTAEQVKNEAKENVIKAIKASPGETALKAKNLVDIAKAEAKVLAGADVDLIAGANNLLDKAEEEFKDIVALLEKRLGIKAVLDSLKPSESGVNFAEAQKILNEIKEDRDFLAKVFGSNDVVVKLFIEKEADVDKAAVSYYQDLANKVAQDISKPSFAQNDLMQLMDHLGAMKEVEYNKFPGVSVDLWKNSLANTFNDNFSKGMECLLSNRSVLDEDGVRSLKRFDFANKNLIEAEKDKEPGHLAGAKDYMEMVLAEQDARRVMTLPSLSFDTLMKARDDFDKALKLSANEKVGDSAKARDLFKAVVERCKTETEKVEPVLERKIVSFTRDGKDNVPSSDEPAGKEVEKKPREISELIALTQQKFKDAQAHYDGLSFTDLVRSAGTDKSSGAKALLEKITSDYLKGMYASLSDVEKRNLDNSEVVASPKLKTFFKFYDVTVKFSLKGGVNLRFGGGSIINLDKEAPKTPKKLSSDYVA
jgi:hypothetical protein